MLNVTEIDLVGIMDLNFSINSQCKTYVDLNFIANLEGLNFVTIFIFIGKSRFISIKNEEFAEENK